MLPHQDLHFHSWINGQQCRGTNSTNIHNPFDGSHVAQVDWADHTQIAQAIDGANQAFSQWQHSSAPSRAQALRQWAQAIEEKRDYIATLMTLESGKPLKEAQSELDYGLSYLYWYSAQCLTATGDVITSPYTTKAMLAQPRPMGVCYLITPWNFPAAMLLRKAAAAIAAGCTVLVKPSELTPCTALVLGELSGDALPAGVLNVFAADAPAAASQIIADARIRKVAFTGSTQVGRILAQLCAQHDTLFKGELGGSAPFIVCADADVDHAVSQLIAAKFRNAGQACVAADRVLVAQAISKSFLNKLHQAISQLQVGNGLLAQTDIGPVISESSAQRLQQQVEEAIGQGAQISVPFSRKQQLIKPCVLTDVPMSCALWQQETFGPVIAIRTFAHEADAIKVANDSPFGLAGYLFSESLQRCWQLAGQLQVGMVGINEGILSCAAAPFGGCKASGDSREGSWQGIAEYQYSQYWAININH